MIHFNNQHIIITGGSSGIGLATAKKFLQLGANVSLIARNPQKLKAAKIELQKIAQSHQRIVTLSADISERLEAENAIKTALEKNGNADILVNSAGIAHPGYFRDIPIEVFEETMAVNYFGSLYCIRAILPNLEQQKRGHIVLISSGAGLIGVYGYTPYSPTKFALRGLAESLRGELKLSGIRVSIVYPPDTDTPQLVEENKTKPPETKEITATAKLWQPDEIAQEIIDGILKNKFAIAPGLEMSLLNRLHSLLLPGLNWYFDQVVQKTRKVREK